MMIEKRKKNKEKEGLKQYREDGATKNNKKKI